MESKPRTRVVLLGASNLTLAFPLVVGRLRACFPGPLEILAAIGHGRSYGQSSRVLSRELPGIDACGLWDALARGDRGEPRETVALLTDLGNDVVYGSEVDAIAGWIDASLARLANVGARTAIVRMPLEVVEGIAPLRFRIARGIIFPGRTIDLATVQSRVRNLDERVLAIARARAASVVDQRGDWYGFDPIHIRRSRRAEAWKTLLAGLLPVERQGFDGLPGALPPADRARLRRARPQWRRLLGREQRRSQPSAELLDGTTIALY